MRAATDYDRDQAMLARYQAGETLAAIAEDHGLSRQRVQQILRDNPQYQARPRWPGTLTYNTAHQRVARELGPARDQHCVDCGQRAEEWSYNGLDADELADDQGLRYSAKTEYYEPRCHSCHRYYDAKHGEMHHNSKLTDAQRRGIRASVLRPYTSDLRELAKHFDVSESLIRQIRTEEPRYSR
jgi:DNA-directed RNA polymerase sigma subunit (sigma70/sigma32)